MVRHALLLIACLAGFTSPASAAEPQGSQFTTDDYEYFERKIRPLLSARCYECHSAEADTLHAGLRLDSASDLERGGDSGAVFVPGQPQASLLIETLSYEGDIQMPPEGKLPQEEIDLLVDWVQRGAPFPPSAEAAERPDGQIDFEAGREFWSFQPVAEQPLPEVTDPGWARRRIDAFVLSAMEREGLQPAPEADRATLIRRLSFDLVGLPPTPDEVQAFVRDDDPEAYEKLVERLLQSPHYGEKWGRMWLDLARYTDMTASWLEQKGEPHLYRDWVVQAFNDNLPYDEFIHRQLATDMLPETGPEDIPALGFLGLSPSYWKELKLPSEIIKVIVADEWEERVDAVSQTFLGLTVACARCHDHKFDPISTEDYYALAGIVASCRLEGRPLVEEELYEPVRLAKTQVADLQAEIAKLKKMKPKENEPDPNIKAEELAAKIQEIESSTPYYNAPLASAVSDQSLFVLRAGERPEEGTKLEYRPGARDLPVFIRGNPNRTGDVVPRRFITVLSDSSQPFEQGSGRLELARAITSGNAASLAARVLVNRIWLAHFGQGLVSTPSNFGQQGSRPSHPQLLDDLAARFIANGWSIKDLHREILLSATWRQSSELDPRKAELDPENRWLSRMNRRRLDFEPWRDAMLAATGRLDLTIGGPSLPLESAENLRRTIYATIHRREMSTTLQIHDFPDPNAHSPQRTMTTTALQGLFALNGPLLAAQSEALVDRLNAEFAAGANASADGVETDRAKIERAHWLLFSRAATDQELQLGLRFLNQATAESRAVAWQQYAHVLLASNAFLFID
ncbi:PSD1 and planctomycete cytochrome C domain-containing protein [Candidatus Laterigemmans baculatus]|uniref:PSD1 and planctomycete cytochrome C domain-containing protein n=1 Tax=Candidatus Laterigemmans baculatus TaxID=2770505 RepID=UPI0013DB529F|nr:PSD1 and planctomycete cytochrome C domain-containing protein [Candidatus Laterigemmans baculatus]